MNSVLGLVLALAGAAAGAPSDSSGAAAAFQESFAVEPSDLAAAGRNPYFILEPGYFLYFTGMEDGRPADLRITVLDETRVIAGVETRVVEERETSGGELKEVSRNFFAISKTTHDVYYFGEDVESYRGGKVVNHDGGWMAGQGENHFGLAMPGAPKVGFRYYQEFAPGVALDRAEVVALDDTLRTPEGRFEQVLKIRETTPLEPDDREYKYYAPGVGLIRDGSLRLQSHGRESR